MTGGLIVEVVPTVTSIQSTTLTSIEPGSDIALPNYPTGSSIHINVCTALETIYFPNLVSVATDIQIGYCTSLTSINFDSLQTLDGYNDDPVSGYLLFIISDCISLTSISLPNFVGWSDISTSPYTEFNVSFNTALTSISLPLWVPNNGIRIDCRNNALDQASVDMILARCVANPAYVSGWVRLNGGTNSTPSAGGLADVATLVARGVTVAHN